MHLLHLSLEGYRNYRHLELDIPPGLVVLHGPNGQGKSNLLEAVYLLAIARSQRAATERELVHWEATQEEGYAILDARVERRAGPLHIRMGLHCSPVRGEDAEGVNVQKEVRINGVPRRTWELVGQLNAVLFSAEDIELVHGPPSGRRRYLDVLLSQVDRAYLRALQRYQRVVTQRNHLLRALREGAGNRDELTAWDASLCREGAIILERRLLALSRLAPMVQELHAHLMGEGGLLEMRYQPSATLEEESSGSLGEALERGLAACRQRETVLAMTLVGPHRDDLSLTAGGVDLSRYASRGHARLAALALRLAEARFLQERSGEEPVILLDDVLSELDPRRRELVLEMVSGHEQVLVTATDLAPLTPAALARAHRFRVEGGTVMAE
ncbi:MAG: DNA replication/repair protein RecF [Chloroflexi bacterium]|nr:DNA replication/repair protein RecF [Chloroflexota bacterium]